MYCWKIGELSQICFGGSLGSILPFSNPFFNNFPASESLLHLRSFLSPSFLVPWNPLFIQTPAFFVTESVKNYGKSNKYKKKVVSTEQLHQSFLCFAIVIIA